MKAKAQANIYKVEFMVDAPAEADYDQVLDWLLFRLGVIGELDGGNPLAGRELEAKLFSVRADLVGRRVEPAERGINAG